MAVHRTGIIIMAKGAVTAVQRNPSLGLCESDLFFENIRARLVAYRAIYPDAKIISLAVGDASEPIPEVITSAMGEYARGLSTPEGFSGYGCHQGVESLRNRIVEVLYKGLGVKASEVFVSDGAKGGLARLQILFGPDVTVAVQDPSYAGEEALNCLEQMQREGFSPNSVTFPCALKACGSVGAAVKGKQIDDEIVSEDLLVKNVVLGSALVDMYAKCGVLAEAHHVLDELPVRNVVSWNVLIVGYAQQVQPKEALNCFERMQHEGLSPDAATFTCVLNACSRSGSVDGGKMYLAIMSKKYGFTPGIEHYTCMVDLFGRAGHFDKAMTVLRKMPSSDYFPAWSALLGACKKWGNVKLGKWAFEQVVQVDKNDGAGYICMANSYATADMHKSCRQDRSHGD